MQPENTQKPTPQASNQIYPEASNNMPQIVTGSQLESQNMLKQEQSAKRRLKLLLACLGLLLFTGIGMFVYSLIQKPSQPSSDLAPPTAIDEQNSSTKATPVTSQPPEKFKDTFVQMAGVGYFTLKYFSDGQYIGACDTNVTKPCAGLYTNAQGTTAFLYINEADKSQRVGICEGQETKSFTFTSSAGQQIQACETGTPNRTLYYSAVLPLKDKTYRVVFIGESTKGSPFKPVNAYKSDLSEIFSSLAVYSG